MAERGVDDDNPFSFKKFVSSKDKTVPREASEVKLSSDTGDSDLDDIFGVNLDPAKDDKSRDESTPSGTTTTGSQKGLHKKDKQKENPFSFKKFISSSSAVIKKGSNITSSENVDTGMPYSLPEQIQVNGRPKDHISGISGTSTETILIPDSFHDEATGKQPLAPLDLPFLDTKVEASSEFKHLHYHEGKEDNEIDSPVSVNDGATSGPLALPDFLTETAIINGRQTVAGPVDDKTREKYEDLLDKNRLLHEENDSLRSELNRERLKSHDKSLKLSQAKVDLERQKKKEAEDMSFLERAVQKVEENLVTTTQRAVQAENTVAKLKQEVRTLQKQLKTLSLETEAYKSGDRGLSDIRERTKYTSDELKTAAIIAEKNIKELMIGVDKLKLLSQVLSSLETVSEVVPEMSQEDDTKPS